MGRNSIMKFRTKSFLIINDLITPDQEMILIKPQGDEILVVHFMLNEIYNPVTHPYEISGIMNKWQGDLNKFAEGKAKNEKPEMEEFVSKSFGYSVRS